jgi:hypothetical protein
MNISALDLRFRHAFGNAIIESDVVICPHSAWVADPRSRDDRWSIASVDGEGDEPLTVALSLCVPAGSSARLGNVYARFHSECVARGM